MLLYVISIDLIILPSLPPEEEKQSLILTHESVWWPMVTIWMSQHTVGGRWFVSFHDSSVFVGGTPGSINESLRQSCWLTDQQWLFSPGCSHCDDRQYVQQIVILHKNIVSWCSSHCPLVLVTFPAIHVGPEHKEGEILYKYRDSYQFQNSEKFPGHVSLSVSADCDRLDQ